VGKPQGKRPLGRPRRIGEDKVGLKKVAFFSNILPICQATRHLNHKAVLVIDGGSLETAG
jgi:hypothetical protein